MTKYIALEQEKDSRKIESLFDYLYYIYLIMSKI